MRQNRRRSCQGQGCQTRMPSGSMDTHCPACARIEAARREAEAERARRRSVVTVRTVGSCSAGVEEVRISVAPEPIWREVRP